MATVQRRPEMLQTEQVVQIVQIAITAKAPIPGLDKTRLIPALGASGAARLHRRLTRTTVACALDTHLGAATVWCTPGLPASLLPRAEADQLSNEQKLRRFR